MAKGKKEEEKGGKREKKGNRGNTSASAEEILSICAPNQCVAPAFAALSTGEGGKEKKKKKGEEGGGDGYLAETTVLFYGEFGFPFFGKIESWCSHSKGGESKGDGMISLHH